MRTHTILSTNLDLNLQFVVSIDFGLGLTRSNGFVPLNIYKIGLKKKQKVNSRTF